MLEDLFGPPDLKVDDGADDGRLGLRAVGGDMGLEFEGGLLAGRIGSGAHRRTRGDVDEGSEWVLREGRGNLSGGVAGDGGNDEGSVEITGGKVGAKLHARVKVTLASTCNNKYLTTDTSHPVLYLDTFCFGLAWSNLFI